MIFAYQPESVALDDWADFLDDAAENVFSQFGEDGLIELLFDRIGTENRWCFEVGASNGRLYSNTKVLRDAGWSAVLIESSDRLVADLRACAKMENDSRVVGVEVCGKTPIDWVLEHAEAPGDMDLGVIDVDGQDYWLWYDMEFYTPRVMLVEYSLRNLSAAVPERIPGGALKHGQAGRDLIVQLGKDKGYRALVATPCNVLFVREDVIEGNDADN